MAKKFITKTTVGETLTKCKAIPTGTKTNKRFAQLERIISRNNMLGDLRCASRVFSGYTLRVALPRGLRCHQWDGFCSTSWPCSKSTDGGESVGVVGEILLLGSIAGGADLVLSIPGPVDFRSRPLSIGIVDARSRIVSKGNDLYDRGWPTICFPTLALSTSTVSVSRHKGDVHIVPLNDKG